MIHDPAEWVYRGNLVGAMASDTRLCPLVQSQLYGMAVRLKLGVPFCEPVQPLHPTVRIRLAQLRAALAQGQQQANESKQ